MTTEKTALQGGAMRVIVQGPAFPMLEKLVRAFPTESRRAMGRIATTLMRRLRQAVASGGGAHGVPSWPQHDVITQLLHPGRRLGGMLSNTNTVQRYQIGERIQVVGWVSGLEKVAVLFQIADSGVFSKEQRRMIYKRAQWDRGIMHWVQQGYRRPARPAIEPFVGAHRPVLLDWFLSAVEKIIRSKK